MLIAIVILAWLVFAAFSAWVLDNPSGDPITGFAYRIIQIYCRLMHRLHVEGAQHIPTSKSPGPLIVVANHTAGIDPFVIQAALPFQPRWMMGKDMMIPALDTLWKWARIIGVSRDGRDTSSAREAMKHVNSGGVLGIFPEGGIERPAKLLRPFLPGVGLIISRTKAGVLPVLVTDTPDVATAFHSIWTTSRTRIRFGPIMQLQDLTPAQSTARIQKWFEDESGWPVSDVSAWSSTEVARPAP